MASPFQRQPACGVDLGNTSGQSLDGQPVRTCRQVSRRH
jgi:hypothetical protein